MKQNALVFLFILVLVSTAWATDAQNMKLVGRYPLGPAHDICVVSNYGYLCSGGAMVILDVSNPSQPTEISWIATPGIAFDVKVAGHYAYVAGITDLNVIDISDPKNPKEVGYCGIPVEKMEYIADHARVYVAGNHAYVVNGKAGLQVIDVSDPKDPHIAGSYDTPDYARDVCVSGNYAYVADETAFRVIDVSDPINLTEAGFCTTDGGVCVREVYVDGNYAYVSGLRVIDISDPKNPKDAGSLDVIYQGNDRWGGKGSMKYYASEALYVSDGYAYVIYYADYVYEAEYGSVLRVIDISDPKRPRGVGYCDSGFCGPDRVYIANGYAYLLEYMGDEDPDLWVINVSDPKNPEKVGEYDTPESAESVYVANGYAYVAEVSHLDEGAMSTAIRVIDVSDPGKPKAVGYCHDTDDTEGECVGDEIYVDNKFAYITYGKYGLWLVDISDPKNPKEVGSNVIETRDPSSYDPYSEASGFHIADGHLCVAIGRDGLWVEDISDPNNPKKGVWYDLPYNTGGVYILDGYAYVVGSDSLRVIDISDPENPKEVGSCDMSGYYGKGVVVIGGYAYVFDAGVDGRKIPGISIIDVSDPKNPKEAGFYNTPSHVYKAYVTNGYVYLVTDQVRVLDVSDPKNPKEVGSYSTAGGASGIYVSDGYIYVADGEAGFCILKYTGQNPKDQH